MVPLSSISHEKEAKIVEKMIHRERCSVFHLEGCEMSFQEKNARLRL